MTLLPLQLDRGAASSRTRMRINERYGAVVAIKSATTTEAPDNP